MKTPKEKAIELAHDCLKSLDTRINENPLIEIKISNKEILERDIKAIELAIVKVHNYLISGTLSSAAWNYFKQVKSELELLKS